MEHDSPQVTLELAKAMVDVFEDYLLKDTLYQQLIVKTAAGDRMLKMSVGTLLEALQDLTYAEEAGQLTSDQSQQLQELKSTVRLLAARHGQAYRAKLVRELKSQLDSWQWFLQDCQEERARCRDEYPFEVRIRNRIALLMSELGDAVPAELAARLEKLDQRLREMLVPGDFLLDKGLAPRYPREQYWWLYGRL